jgi:hypothetical protein
MDPGEMGAILEAREVGDPARQEGERADSWYRTVEAERQYKNASEHKGRACHNTKPRLCTEYVSLSAVH